MPSKDRQREIARNKLERHMARRAQQARRRRQIYAGIGAGVTLLAVVAVTAILVITRDGDETSPTAQGPTCVYLDPARGTNRIKDVGKPDTTDVPDSGSVTVSIDTNLGNLDLALNREAAPCSVNSFVHLARSGFYDGTTCHRLTTSGIFVLQCGDPFGDGAGGPSYQFGVENTPTNDYPPYPVGSVALARQGNDPNSNGSQFFIVYEDSPNLGADYSLIGKVTSGLDVITDKVAPGGVTDEKEPGSGDGKPKTEVKLEDITTAPDDGGQ